MATRPASSAESGNVVHLPLRAPRLPSGVGPSAQPKAPPVAEPRRSNSFAEAARYRKVQAIVGWIDRVAVSRAIDPLKNPKDVALLLRAVSEQGWEVVAKRANVNPPSAETIALVFEEYDRRASLVAPPAPVTRFFVMREDSDAFARKYVVGREDGYDTEAEAIAVRDERRAYGQTSGNGFAETVWVQPREVRP